MKNSKLWEEFDPLGTNSLSELSSKDLLDVVTLLNESYLQLRTTLFLPQDITFGLEPEFEKANKEAIFNEFKEKYFLKNWCLKPDGSLDEGEEVNSPILTDKKEHWIDLAHICKTLQNNSVIGNKAGGHIHIGSRIIQWDEKAIRNLLKMWAAYENITFRFGYGEYLSPRPDIGRYATPIARMIDNRLNQIERNTDSLSTAIWQLKGDRYRSLNLTNARLLEESRGFYKQTIEFRSPNATLNPVIWQNNVNYFAKMVLYCMKKDFREDIVSSRLEKNDDILSDLDWYQEIFLEEALELADLIFDKNIDKFYFLRQYLKDFDRVEDKKQLVKAKTFTR